MRNFIVEITETLCKDVLVEASDEREDVIFKVKEKRK